MMTIKNNYAETQINTKNSRSKSRKISSASVSTVAKTLLYSYPVIPCVLDGMENLIFFKAVSSFTDCSKTLAQVDNILRIRNQSDRLKCLKRAVSDILSGFDADERNLISYKYFNRTMPADFEYTSRRYFRRQKRVLDKFIDKMVKLGYTEKWFEENYEDIAFLKTKYSLLKNYEKSSERANAAHARSL